MLLIPSVPSQSLPTNEIQNGGRPARQPIRPRIADRPQSERFATLELARSCSNEVAFAWTRQISTLQIDDKRDFLISDDGGDAEVSAARERVSSRAR